MTGGALTEVKTKIKFIKEAFGHRSGQKILLGSLGRVAVRSVPGSVACERGLTQGAARASHSSANLVTHVIPSCELNNSTVVVARTFLFTDHHPYFKKC